MTDPELQVELLERVSEDWRLAEALFAAVGSDTMLETELDRLLESPATPLLTALATWDERPEEANALIDRTAANAMRLAEIVEKLGWPGLAVAGGLGADAAWLIAQHADLQNDLRREWLDALEIAVRTGEADPRHLACLVDRIAVVDGEPQTYGTVAVLEDGSLTLPHQVREAGELEARRANLGLPSTEEDVSVLEAGDIIPFGPDRGEHALMQWPAKAT